MKASRAPLDRAGFAFVTILIFRAGFARFALADFFGFRFAISDSLGSLGETLRDDFTCALKFGDGGVNIAALVLQALNLLLKPLRRDPQLCRLPVTKVVQIEHGADFLERETNLLAQQHKLQARAVAAAVDAVLPFAAGRQELTFFVKAQRARRYAEFAGKIANAKRFFCLIAARMFRVEARGKIGTYGTAPTACRIHVSAHGGTSQKEGYAQLTLTSISSLER